MAESKEHFIADLRRLAPQGLTAVQDFVRALLEDAEELTSQELAEVEASEAEIARGEWVHWEDVWEDVRRTYLTRSR